MAVRPWVVVEDNHLGVCPLKMMTSNLLSEVWRNGNGTLLTSHMVKAFDLGRLSVAIAVTDD